ncbi:MAG: flagellar hook-associated protein FlgK, partial [Candidatus Hydrogenedentes bacterium]|nr:flagellar hook-associated protein FlgK [Candidatus Hydrogenedentota bacterium]
MGSLFSALNIARSGLLSAQIQLDVAGHNISNVNTPGFSRQRAMLNTQVPSRFGYGVLGRGVGVTNIERARDPFLDQVFRRQAPAVAGAEVRTRFYALLEDSFHDPGANGFSERINAFFDSVNDFTNNVEILPAREALLAEAQTLATSFNQLGDRFAALRTDANNGISAIVDELNAQAAQVARLNDQIPRLESSGREANDLRDERDVILDDLARLADVTVRENAHGQVDILIGNGALVTGSVVQRLEAVRNPAIDPSRPDFVEVRFAGSGRVIDVQDGELGAAFDVRDTIVPGFQDRLDTLARTFIREVNNVHAQGQGLENLSGTLVSDNAVSASGAPLISAGLPFDVTPGTFDIVTYDAAGTPTTTTISITAATSLDDLASDISAIGGLSAAVSGGRL